VQYIYRFPSTGSHQPYKLLTDSSAPSEVQQHQHQLHLVAGCLRWQQTLPLQPHRCHHCLRGWLPPVQLDWPYAAAAAAAAG
jgi:hypothetical protein